MRSSKTTHLTLWLVIPLMLLSGLTFSGCGIGGKELRTIIVFPGEDTVARIATNHKIPVVVKGKDGKAHHELKDIGQAVVQPLHRYRQRQEMIKRLKEENIKLKAKPDA